MIYISNLVSRRCRTSSRFAAALISSSVLLFGASLALSGCASSQEEQRYSWPLATASPEDTVTQLFAEKFAEEVHDLSNGAMRIQVYANSTLGGDRDLLDDCRKKLDDPDFYNLISQVYTDGGYHLLGMADQGFRIMSTNKPVYSLVDFKGQKIRTMENSYHLAFWKAIGANPTPMTFSEVYIGLQQHTIDAQENPYEVIVSNRLYEQQDYVVETNHLPHLISLIVNDDFFQNLTPEEQKIMTQAAKTATEYAREQSDARIFDRIATIEASGTAILTLSDETRDAIRKAAGSVYESIRENIDPEIYDAYMEP